MNGVAQPAQRSLAVIGRPSRDVPPLWLLAALLAMSALHRWVPVGTWLAPPWQRVGWALIVPATLLGLSSAHLFVRRGTGLRPFTPATELVQEGAFRWSRNPMYVAMLGVSLGMAVCCGTWGPMLVPPLLFLVYSRRFVRREEAWLRQRFGVAYDDYCRRVRRWL